jgi:hypothetical protein
MMNLRKLPVLTAQMSGGYHVEYTSSGDFSCLSFFNCPHWQKTTKISWEHLPTFKFAVFYENGICSPSGKYTVADPVTEGSVTFSTAQTIRSVMVGYGGVANHKHKADSISKACPIEKDDDEGLIINFTPHRVSDNAAVENATLSSNWHDDLA